jgi:hypothetical protein
MSGIFASNVTDKSSDYDRRIIQWRRIRDVLEGEDQIKIKRAVYMPRPRAQNADAYNQYVERANFYGVAERTVRGLVGLVFRISPMIELPERIEYLTDFTTPDGTPLEGAIKDAVRETVSLGRYGILVDMGQSSAAINEAAPFIAPYEAEAIWRWDEVLDPQAGKRRLVRVILQEAPATHDGQEITWLRELFLEQVVDEEGVPIPGAAIYRQQLWREQDAETRAKNLAAIGSTVDIVETEGFDRFGEPMTPLMNGRPLTEIPFWFINTFNTRARPDKPPMLDLANMNLAHWRNSADYEQLLHLVGSPTPWAAANWEEGEAPAAIGAGARWLLPAGATVGVLEFNGSSAAAFQTAMSDKEDRMAALGARLIRNQERANVTAETTKAQSVAETSVLMNAVQNVESAFTAAISFLAAWAGSSEGEIDDIRIELNKDFFGVPMSPQDLTALVGGWQSGAYSRQTLWENLQKGEIADPKRTLEEELELIEEEMPELPNEVDTGFEDEDEPTPEEDDPDADASAETEDEEEPEADAEA